MWREEIFSRHFPIVDTLRWRYLKVTKRKGYKVANDELRRIDDALTIHSPWFTAAMDDDSIRDCAVMQAKKIESLFERNAVEQCGDIFQPGFTDSGNPVIDFVQSWGLVFPLVIKKSDSPSEICENYLNAVKRVSDDKWWRRQLRKELGRRVEAVLRQVGAVRKQSAPYVSWWALRRWGSAQRRNQGVIGSLEAVKFEAGEEVVCDLSTAVETSVSNPTNRRNELMVRMRGYEEVAQSLGLVGLFLTLTSPSKYHPYTHGGQFNPKYNGSTPADCIDYLNAVWANIRAKWQREGIRVFGFRVAEPHHDGTPHFHFMLFINPDWSAKAWNIFRDYALAEDGDEPGALLYRADCKAIDPAKGTAAGYMAKYVAKNIDGTAVGFDLEGETTAEHGAACVRAWASTWGIRQFQQIGSVSVTVWRELRRYERPEYEDTIADFCPTPEQFEAIREAADAADWAAFVKLMGGAFVKRDEQAIRPWREEILKRCGRYGEPVRRVIGLIVRRTFEEIERGLAREECVSTRDGEWQIRQKELVLVQAGAQPPPSDLCQ